MRNIALMLIPTTLLMAACDSSAPSGNKASEEPSAKTAASSDPSKKSPDASPKAFDPATMPPSISASRQYRCADRSLLFVDFMSDEKSVLVRTEARGFPTRLTGEKNDVMKGNYYTLKGGKADKFVMFSSPEKPSPQRCQA